MLVDRLDCFCVKSPTWRWCAPGGLPAAGLAEQQYGSGLDELADSCLLGASSLRAGWTCSRVSGNDVDSSTFPAMTTVLGGQSETAAFSVCKIAGWNTGAALVCSICY